jgi:hypothetical protein
MFADGSDRTAMALKSQPALISDIDIRQDEPLKVEDSYITALGSFPQPAGQLPIIAGFIYVTRVFRILSRILTLHRRATTGEMLDYSAALQSCRNELSAVLDFLPPQLDAKQDQLDSVRQQGGAFETCKANVLVTQALTRFEMHQLSVLTGNGEQDLEPTTDVLRQLDLQVCAVVRWRILLGVAWCAIFVYTV